MTGDGWAVERVGPRAGQARARAAGMARRRAGAAGARERHGTAARRQDAGRPRPRGARGGRHGWSGPAPLVVGCVGAVSDGGRRWQVGGQEGAAGAGGSRWGSRVGAPRLAGRGGGGAGGVGGAAVSTGLGGGARGEVGGGGCDRGVGAGARAAAARARQGEGAAQTGGKSEAGGGRAPRAARGTRLLGETPPVWWPLGARRAPAGPGRRRAVHFIWYGWRAGAEGRSGAKWGSGSIDNARSAGAAPAGKSDL
jgi:hypothetical protein